MRFTSRSCAAVVAAAGIVLAAAGCGGSYESGGSDDGSPATRPDGTLRVNFAVAPATLDPASGCGVNDLALIGNVYARLTKYGSKPGPENTTEFDPAKIETDVAESMKVSGDGKTYTFKLPGDLKFPSGEPVDAKAVKYSIERTMTVNGCGGFFVIDGIPGLIEKIETPDPQTVVFRLGQPDPNFPEALAQPAAGIVDESVVAENGGVKKNTVNEWMQSHVAGYGPFVLDAYEPNRRAVLKANPDWKGEPPASDTIEINYVNADPTLLLQARSGDADVTIGLSKQSVKSLEGRDGVKIVANESPLSEQIGLPNGKKPFDNLKFREALTYALPYQEIVDKVAFGYGTLFFGPLQPVLTEYNEQLSQPRQYDAEKAEQLIRESGVKTPVEIQMVIQEGNTAEEQIATIAQGEWRKLGVEVKIRKLPAAEYITGLQEHKYQSYVRLDGPGVIDAGYYLGYDMLCDVGFNLSELCIPRADKLHAQARRETDDAERQRLYDEITKLWVADSPKIHVYADRHVAVLSEDVRAYHYAHETDMRTWSK
jgi:peptide/nickel transport system substrate-binding protein